ncbi:MAG: oligopeptide:H+ symporter [Methanobrevibacter sp.]|jgi:POT family proton-dependent oligopeptide transporter|nr:oligopeptide:H+ symporter [Methanobrevibacter sp.]
MFDSVNGNKLRGFLGVEALDSFSFFGFYYLLIFYLTSPLIDGGLGISDSIGLKIVALFGAILPLAGLFSGYIADKYLTPSKMIVIGCFLYIFGYILLCFNQGSYLLMFPLLLIILGNGFVKPMLSSLIGSLYDNDKKRDFAYSLFYLVINVSGTLTAIILGYLSFTYGFNLSFFICIACICIALCYFVLTNKLDIKKSNNLNDCNHSLEKSIYLGLLTIIGLIILFVCLNYFSILSVSEIFTIISIILAIIPITYFFFVFQSNEITKFEKNNVLSFIPIFISVVFILGVQNQIGEVIPLFINEHVALLSWMEPTDLTMLQPFFVVIITIINMLILNKNIKFKNDFLSRFSGYNFKIMLSLLLSALSFLFFIIPLVLDGHDKVGLIWPILAIFFMSVSELIAVPIGLSLAYKLAPVKFKTSFIALIYVGATCGEIVNMSVNNSYNPNSPLLFFEIFFILLLIITICYFYFNKIIENRRL